MIHASELRKGNLINTEYGILPVHAIVFNSVQVKGKDGRILWANKIEGVKLSEELLLKFGFITYTKEYYVRDKFILNPKFKLRDVCFDITFKYAHKLQNCFYELTGKELTLTNA